MEIVPSEDTVVVEATPASRTDLRELWPDKADIISKDEITEEEWIRFDIIKALVTSRVPVRLMAITGPVKIKGGINRAITTRLLIKLWHAGVIRRFYILKCLPDHPRNHRRVHYLVHNIEGYAVPKIDPKDYLTKRQREYRGEFFKELSDDDVRAIRKSDLTAYELAHKYNVGVNHIYAIRNYRARKNVA